MADSSKPEGQREDEKETRAASSTPADDTDELDEAVADNSDEAAELVSAAAKPVRRNQTVAPVKKSKPTPKQDSATKKVHKPTTPVQFTKQSIGELRKVVWPTGANLRQYFIVVLIFVLFIMFFVAGLDALFGWLLLLWLGR